MSAHATPFPPAHPAGRLARSLFAALLATALGGCASVYLVDNQVQSFARWDEDTASPPTAALPQAPQVYRFERLPSQRDGRAASGQDEVEGLARAALARVGWSLADPGVASPWTVQVNAATLRSPRAPWDDPWDGFWPGFGMPGRDYVVTGSGQVIWSPVFMRMEPPYYQRKVSLLIRQAASGHVVYETQAAHDGRWGSSPELWSAMFDAALRDFPAPPKGPRQVNIEVPR